MTGIDLTIVNVALRSISRTCTPRSPACNGRSTPASGGRSPFAACKRRAARWRLLASRGGRLPLTLGGALLAIGGFLLIPLTTHTESAYLLGAYAIFGLGAGRVSPPVTSTAIAGLPPDQVGVPGALAASARQFGIASRSAK